MSIDEGNDSEGKELSKYQSLVVILMIISLNKLITGNKQLKWNLTYFVVYSKRGGERREQDVRHHSCSCQVLIVEA